MKKNAFILFVFLIAVFAKAAEKNYQTGKLLDVNSQLYNKVIDGDSYVRHENSLFVRVGNVIYEGQCEERRHFSSCKPANWIIGDDINVRFEKDYMYLQKTNGDEVKTKLVKRTKAN
ncbi:MAG: hypothetical protein ABSE55_03490 [Terracidiphilus sp.]|jgi:hypothetical protein